MNTLVLIAVLVACAALPGLDVEGPEAARRTAFETKGLGRDRWNDGAPIQSLPKVQSGDKVYFEPRRLRIGTVKYLRSDLAYVRWIDAKGKRQGDYFELRELTPFKEPRKAK